MIPLHDEGKRGFPFFNWLLIVSNIFVLVYQQGWGHLSPQNYVHTMGLIPGELTREFAWHPTRTIFTSMFMHAGVVHLISNMWFLWVFGDNIEYALGSIRFLLFYLMCGAFASLTHVAMYPTSPIPLVGASGAIAGILGAYLMLFPKNRIVTLVPLFLYVTTVRIPAAIFLGFWFAGQVVYSRMGGNVAWWAHIGGFVTGLLFVRLFLPRPL